MEKKEFDWTKFKKRIYIEEKPNVVFETWTIPQNLEKWFIAKAEYFDDENNISNRGEIVKSGLSYYWRWHQDLDIKGKVLSVQKNELFSFTFGKNEKTNEDIVVTVTFKESEGKTLLELTQNNIANTPSSNVGWYMGCNLGWSFFITNLKAYLEHGVDLREYDPKKAYECRALTLD